MTRYSSTQRYLHWSIAVLLAAAYIFIEQRGLFARGSAARLNMMQAHYWTGLAIAGLAVWRILLRWRRRAPPIVPPPPAWQAWSAAGLHLTLYAFLVVMPLLGLATAWADGKVLYVPFTEIALPALLPQDKGLAERLEDLHGGIGEFFYWVIGLHVLAAFYHHWIRRDDSLRRML